MIWIDLRRRTEKCCTKFEFAKHHSLFSVLLALLLLLLNIGITAWQYRGSFTDEGRQIAAAQAELIALYNTDREEYDLRLADFNDRVSAYEVDMQISLVRNGTMPVFENKLIDFPTYGDSQLFRDVKNVVNAPQEYHDAVYALLRDASLRLYELENTDSYIYRYYIELISKYDRFAEVEFEAKRILGWNEFFSLETPLIFLTLASLALFCGTFTVEDRAGMTNLLRVSRRGGSPMTLVKLGYVGVTSVVLTVVFTLSPLLVFALSGGLSSLDAPLQLLDEFTYCRFDLTVGQYLVIYTAVRVLIMLCFSLVVAVIGQYSGSEMPAFVFTVVLAVEGILMDGIDPQSAYYSLAKYSPTALANVNILFTRYRGVNFFGACLDYTFVVIAVTAVLIVAAVALAFTRGAKKSVHVLREKKKFRNHRMSLSLFGAESYKIFVCEGGLSVILAAVLLKCVISGVYYQPTVGMDESTYAEYIAQVQGEVTDEKLAYIDAEAEYIETMLGQYSSMQKQYRDGEITSEEYNEYLSRYNYANFCDRACERLCERRDYVVEMSETHENIQFLYEAGIEKYLTAPLDITAVLAAVFIFGNVFAVEYEKGFSKILRLKKRGGAVSYICCTLAMAVMICAASRKWCGKKQ